MDKPSPTDSPASNQNGTEAGEPARRPHVEVVRVTPALAEPVAEFFRRVWDRDTVGEDVRRSIEENAQPNPAVPGVPATAVVFLRDRKVLGYLGTIPTKFWADNAEHAGHWLKGFMVLPEHRNGPVGFMVLKEMLKHIGLSGSMAVAEPARRLLAAVGYVDCGALANHICPIRPARLARELDLSALGLPLQPWIIRTATLAQRVGVAATLAHVGGLGLAIWRFVLGRAPGLSIDTTGVMPASAMLDDLWRRARAGISAAPVRDGPSVRWSYDTTADEAQGARYQVAATFYKHTGRLASVAVVRRPGDAPDPRLHGVKVATLSDILFDPNDPMSGVAAIAGAEKIARRLGADALLCSCSHPAITDVLRRRAFVTIPGNVHLMVRDPSRSVALPTDIASWWVTRGDGKADEAF